MTFLHHYLVVLYFDRGSFVYSFFINSQKCFLRKLLWPAICSILVTGSHLWMIQYKLCPLSSSQGYFFSHVTDSFFILLQIFSAQDLFTLTNTVMRLFCLVCFILFWAPSNKSLSSLASWFFYWKVCPQLFFSWEPCELCSAWTHVEATHSCSGHLVAKCPITHPVLVCSFYSWRLSSLISYSVCI